jgi:hypothetical protein
VNAGFVMLVRASLYREGKQKLYPIITQLRKKGRASREFLGELMNQDRRHRRHCSLDSIDIQFAKVEVAGSNPVSRF